MERTESGFFAARQKAGRRTARPVRCAAALVCAAVLAGTAVWPRHFLHMQPPRERTAIRTEEEAATGQSLTDVPKAAGDAADGGQPADGAFVTVSPADGDFLALVNDSHRLADDYAPQLQTVAGSEKQLERHAAQALEELLAAAAQAGVPCHVVSGYRSVAYQRGLFARRVQRCLNEGLSAAQADAEAARWVARPGASEHALGLAVDLVSNDWYLHHDDLTEAFEQTAQFRWLQQHAAEYGFILRYPKGREAVTGVHYEPWHYRYVGGAAAELAASGLTLEEYCAGR